MIQKQDLMTWVYEALAQHNGEAGIVDVARHIWANHEADLRASGDLFYTWQYDMRWAAMLLRKEGKVAPASAMPRGVWTLVR